MHFIGPKLMMLASCKEIDHIHMMMPTAMYLCHMINHSQLIKLTGHKLVVTHCK